MTQPTRMLIVLGVFGVGTVVVLALMAQRYGKLLQRVEPSPPAVSKPSGPAESPRADADSGAPAGSFSRETIEAQVRALRSVDAFIAVRRALMESRGAGPDAAADGVPSVPSEDQERALARALADAGLDRASYDAILELYAAWKAGRADLSGPVPEAFARRGEELERLE